MDSDPEARPEAFDILEMPFIKEFQEREISKTFKLDLPQGKLSKSGRRIIIP